MRMWVGSLASLRALRIWHCCELWCWLQMQFLSHIAVVLWCRLAAAVPIWLLAREPPCAVEAALKRKKKKNWKKVRASVQTRTQGTQAGHCWSLWSLGGWDTIVRRGQTNAPLRWTKKQQILHREAQDSACPFLGSWWWFRITQFRNLYFTVLDFQARGRNWNKPLWS